MGIGKTIKKVKKAALKERREHMVNAGGEPGPISDYIESRDLESKKNILKKNSRKHQGFIADDKDTENYQKRRKKSTKKVDTAGEYDPISDYIESRDLEKQIQSNNYNKGLSSSSAGNHITDGPHLRAADYSNNKRIASPGDMNGQSLSNAEKIGMGLAAVGVGVVAVKAVKRFTNYVFGSKNNSGKER